MKNQLRRHIAEKGSAVGSFLGLSNLAMVECLGYTGLDFVIIDTEHGPYDTMPMSDMIQTAERSGLAPLVRIADLTHREIQHAADNGAQGIIVPCLRSVEEFRKAVELAKFAPVGNRVFIKGRGSGFGNREWSAGSLEEYMEQSNERLLMLPQCETREALAHIEEIAAIPGLDGIFIGPFDLSISMGIPAQFDHPDFTAALLRIQNVCREAGKLCLIYANSLPEGKARLAEGYDAVAVSMDSAVFTEAYRSLVQQLRGRSRDGRRPVQLVLCIRPGLRRV